MIGVVITVKDRYDATALSFRCIARTDYKGEWFVVVVDDGSVDFKVRELCKTFDFGVPTIRYRNDASMKVFGALRLGIGACWNAGATIVANLDNDVVLRKDWLQRLVEAKKGIPNIVTGFNCFTKNRNGSERHKVVKQGEGWNMKASVGGINMVIDREGYDKWMLPALEASISRGGNWDHMTCINSFNDGFPVLCIEPSVVQHQLVPSSMGHHEPPDKADDFYAIEIPDVTLIGVTGTELPELIKAADISCKYIKFGAVKLLSSMPSSDKRVVPIEPIKSKEAYNEFVVKRLNKYVDTENLLIIQADGYVLNWEAWNDDWLNWDYIGAPWNWYSDHKVGNGGFSLRTKWLHDVLAKDKVIMETYPEDHQICRVYKNYLESKHKISFAPIEVAERFSIEAYKTPPPGNRYSGQFGFHGYNVDFRGAGVMDAPIPPRRVVPSVPRLVREKQLQRQNRRR
jgi:hypothetical protein